MSEAEPNAPAALQWLRYASDDLDAAAALLAADRPLPRHVCWLAQQAAEKALKAVLVLDGEPVPFTHDLHDLRSRIGRQEASLDMALANLMAWGATARYPGARRDPAVADAVKAAADGREVYAHIVALIEQRGVSVPGS